jgi:hypothetical protein
MAIQALYRQHAYFYHVTNSKGQYGDIVEVATLFAGPIACYCTYLSGGKQVFSGKIQVIATHRLFCNPQPILKSNDKVYVEEYKQWFNILYIDNCNAMNHHWELLLEMIADPQEVEDLGSSSSSSSSSEEYSDSSDSSDSDSSESSSESEG